MTGGPHPRTRATRECETSVNRKLKVLFFNFVYHSESIAAVEKRVLKCSGVTMESIQFSFFTSHSLRILFFSWFTFIVNCRGRDERGRAHDFIPSSNFRFGWLPTPGQLSMYRNIIATIWWTMTRKMRTHSTLFTQRLCTIGIGEQVFFILFSSCVMSNVFILSAVRAIETEKLIA